MKSTTTPFLIISLVILLVVFPMRFLFIILIIGVFYMLFNTLWLKSSERLRWKLKKQGIYGPKPSFLYGNVAEMQKIQASSPNNNNVYAECVAHDYTSSLFPYFEQWRKIYGNIIYLSSSPSHILIYTAFIFALLMTRTITLKVHPSNSSLFSYRFIDIHFCCLVLVIKEKIVLLK